jgi:hypothetical protein
MTGYLTLPIYPTRRTDAKGKGGGIARMNNGDLPPKVKLGVGINQPRLLLTLPAMVHGAI